MRVLLTAINAKYIHSNLAVYSLRASAGRYEPQVELLEYTINHQPEEIFAGIYRKEPELLLFSCYIWNRRAVIEAADALKKVLPGTVIWAGGPEVSYDAEEFLRQNPQFDGVMRGEGERTFYRLLEYYIGGVGELAEIPGIAWRRSAELCPEDGRGSQICSGPEETAALRSEVRQAARLLPAAIDPICRTAPVCPMTSLDELPFVYRDLSQFENRILYYESSRGCPFSCSYCLSSVDKQVRYRSLELVERDLAFFLEKRVKQVKFVDRTFNCSHARTLAIWRFLKEHDNGVTNFHFEISADLLNEEELEVLGTLRPGLVQLEIGVQTVNREALAAIHRSAPFEKIAEHVNRISRGHNIHQHLDLIAGLPYEGFESFRESFDAVYRLYPQELQLGFLKVLKGSEMHRRAEEYGILYRGTPPYEVLATRWITCGELLRLKEIEEMLEVYYNSQQFRFTIRAAEALFARPIELYEALADYYKEEKLFGRAHSRGQRLEILRQFMLGRSEKCASADAKKCAATDVKKCPAADVRKCAAAGIEGSAATAAAAENSPAGGLMEEQIFDTPGRAEIDELLLLDLYLRENAKSRPAWAPDPGETREETIRFYQEEERTRRYLPHLAGRNWKQLMRMTHLEHFAQLGGRERWLLFDYEHRDPLTQDAGVREIAEDGSSDGRLTTSLGIC